MRWLGALLLGAGLAVTACGGAGDGLTGATAQVSGDGPAGSSEGRSVSRATLRPAEGVPAAFAWKPALDGELDTVTRH
ncbi:hypothetical protein [Microtetraspora fusca]|uniref:hypothetical protein n=1 Tax=Microtetraspora fusca TaxID=1997 RepID=UPI000836A31D|nr:hypothetical protein [Microtetraspora fusca]